MKTYYIAKEIEGTNRYHILCDYHGDKHLTHAFQNLDWSHEQAWEITHKLNDVLALGAKKKAEEIRYALGMK
jgi:molybdenum-dependent DNA-binding transcriptional regulator ModE